MLLEAVEFAIKYLNFLNQSVCRIYIHVQHFVVFSRFYIKDCPWRQKQKKVGSVFEDQFVENVD
jgi:hypothetical protein